MRSVPVYFAAIIVLLAGCTTKHTVLHVETKQVGGKTVVQNKDPLTGGAFYALPRTVVTVAVPVEKTTTGFSSFWNEYVDEIAAVPIANAFTAISVDRWGSDKKKIAGILDVARRSIGTAFRRGRTAAQAQADIAGAAADAALRARLLKAGFNVAEQRSTLNAIAAGAATIAGQLATFRTFQAKLDKAGIELSTPKDVQYRLKPPTFTTGAEPDPDHVYYYKVTGGGMLTDRVFTMELTEAGVITSGISHATDKTLDTIVQVVSTAAKIAGSLALGFNPLAAVTTTIGKGEQALIELSAVRAQRRNLRTGGPNDYWSGGSHDLKVFERLLKETNQVEAGLVAYFRSRTTATWTAKFETRPDVAGEVLFKFDRSKGIHLAAAHKLVGKPQPGFVFTPAAGVDVKLSWSTKAPGGGDLGHGRVAEAIETHASSKRRVPEEQGFRYRVPRQATAELSQGPLALGSSRLAVAQFGSVLSLPSKPGGTNTKIDTSYYKDTGALKKVMIDKKAPNVAGAVKDVGDAATTLIDTRQSKEIDDLKRRKEKLELEKAIRDLEKEKEIADKSD